MHGSFLVGGLSQIGGNPCSLLVSQLTFLERFLFCPSLPRTTKNILKRSMTPTATEWDLSNLEMISGGDQKVLREHLRHFLETLGEETKALESAFSCGETAEIQRTAHRLLSHFAIVNAHELLQVTREIHRLADNQRTEAAEATFAQYSRLIGALQVGVSAEAYPLD